MNFSTVLIISLAAGVILVVGGGLMMYMSNLVKSAYDLKVQINTDIEERLGKLAEDLDKKSRWIKRDLLEEIEKIRANLATESSTRVNDLAGPLLVRLEALETALKAEREAWVKSVDSDRAAIANLDNRVKALTRQAKDGKESKDEAPAEGGEAKPAEPRLAGGEIPKPAPAAANPGQPRQGASPSEWLPDLGGKAG